MSDAESRRQQSSASQQSPGMQLLSIGGRLAVVCVTAAVVLALVNAVTAPVIVENKRRAFEEGIQAILDQAEVPGLRLGEPVTERALSAAVSSAQIESGSVTAVYPISQSGQDSGYIADLVGLGYGGEMQILAGYDPSGSLFAAQLMGNTETPGLGKKAEAPQYMQKFVGHGSEGPIPTSKTELEPAEADAISGATVTFIGVAQALELGRRVILDLESR